MWETRERLAVSFAQCKGGRGFERDRFAKFVAVMAR